MKRITNKEIMGELGKVSHDIGILWVKIDHLAGVYKDFLHTPNNCPHNQKGNIFQFYKELPPDINL